MQLNIKKINARSKCSISCSLDILGDKWTLLIIRDALFLNMTSFNKFRNSEEKIASNILTNRMEKLVKYGILNKTQNEDNKLKFDYQLTEKGKDLKPIIIALGDWGDKHIKGTNNVVTQVKKYHKS